MFRKYCESKSLILFCGQATKKFLHISGKLYIWHNARCKCDLQTEKYIYIFYSWYCKFQMIKVHKASRKKTYLVLIGAWWTYQKALKPSLQSWTLMHYFSTQITRATFTIANLVLEICIHFWQFVLAFTCHIVLTTINLMCDSQQQTSNAV